MRYLTYMINYNTFERAPLGTQVFGVKYWYSDMPTALCRVLSRPGRSKIGDGFLIFKNWIQVNPVPGSGLSKCVYYWIKSFQLPLVTQRVEVRWLHLMSTTLEFCVKCTLAVGHGEQHVQLVWITLIQRGTLVTGSTVVGSGYTIQYVLSTSLWIFVSMCTLASHWHDWLTVGCTCWVDENDSRDL